jgi:hypothetical protein
MDARRSRMGTKIVRKNPEETGYERELGRGIYNDD